MESRVSNLVTSLMTKVLNVRLDNKNNYDEGSATNGNGGIVIIVVARVLLDFLGHNVDKLPWLKSQIQTN